MSPGSRSPRPGSSGPSRSSGRPPTCWRKDRGPPREPPGAPHYPIVYNMDGALHAAGGVRRPADSLSQVLWLHDHGFAAQPTRTNSVVMWDWRFAEVESRESCRTREEFTREYSEPRMHGAAKRNHDTTMALIHHSEKNCTPAGVYVFRCPCCGRKNPAGALRCIGLSRGTTHPGIRSARRTLCTSSMISGCLRFTIA